MPCDAADPCGPIRLFHVDPCHLDRHPPDRFISAFQRWAARPIQLGASDHIPDGRSVSGSAVSPNSSPSLRLAPGTALVAQERSLLTILLTSAVEFPLCAARRCQAWLSPPPARCGGTWPSRLSRLHRTCPAVSVIRAEVGSRLCPHPASRVRRRPVLKLGRGGINASPRSAAGFSPSAVSRSSRSRGRAGPLRQTSAPNVALAASASADSDGPRARPSCPASGVGWPRAIRRAVIAIPSCVDGSSRSVHRRRSLTSC